MKRIKWSLFLAMLVFLALMQASFALASPGYTGYSGKTSGRTCASCHSGGTAPTVTISGPTTSTPGSVNNYTMKITGGTLSGGYCDIAASGGSLGAGTGDTLKNSEISGSSTTKSGTPPAVSFPFTWTAPSTAGTYTLYGCGLSTNGNGGTSGDGSTAIQFTIAVAGSTNVSVPNVVNQTQAAATSAITAAGLTLGSVTTQASSTVTAGSVISQNPAAAASVASGSAVNLVVSSGSAPVSVPNVVGQTQAAATTAITNAKLVLGTVTQQASSTVTAGSVISQNPAAAASVASGSAVNLVVSSGSAPVSVPNVVGQTQAAATTAITNAKLVLGTVTQQASSTVTAGSVISQNPAAAASVASGSAVNLVVSSGSAPVSVPNVVGPDPSCGNHCDHERKTCCGYRNATG